MNGDISAAILFPLMAFSGHIQLRTKKGKGSLEGTDIFLRIQYSQ